MNVDSSWFRRVKRLPLVAVGLCGAWAQPVAAMSPVRSALLAVQFQLSASAAAPGVLGHVHRLASHSERTLSRLAALVINGLDTWLWMLLSAALFLVVTAIASAADLRMFTSGWHNPQASTRDLVHGVRMFFRIVRDARTPYLPRAVVVMALLYWLLPVDLLGDGMPVVGMLDDLLIAVLAAKLFIYLCPDAVIAAHAAALRTGA